MCFLIIKINSEILAGAKKSGGKVGKNIFVENDRGAAINLAINSLAKKGDTIGIFGKGHERSMNIDGNKAEELKQLWIHDDANEVDEDEYYSERFIYMHCPNCDYKYFCDLGD